MRRVILLVSALLLLAACGGAPAAPASAPAAPAATATPEPDATDAVDEPDEPDEPEAPALVVMSTVAPIADVVAQVGGDRVEVRSLVPPGVDAHTYEPRPSDAAALQEVDAFIGVGYDLNPGAVQLAEANLADGAPLLLLAEDALDADDLIAGDDDAHGHSHGDDADDDAHGHSHGDDADDDAHGHSHGDDDAHSGDDADDRTASTAHGADGHTHERNPHIWTSVRLVADTVDHVADLLADLDPEGEGTYTANADAFLARLDALDAAIAEATATIPEDDRTMVVYHDAWGYFAADHGLAVVAAVQPSDFSEPSAADVRAIIDQIRDEGVPAIFGSEVFPNQVTEVIAAETGADYVGTLADDVLPGDPGDPEHSYEGLMLGNARTIVEALGGDARALDAIELPRRS
jgi:ABC-type Zn uptake system ZnuABC Zn-binding protein ZnuA